MPSGAPPTVLRVALPVPLRQCFDYLVPTGQTTETVSTGTRVKVPFGRRTLVGVLLEVVRGSQVPGSRLRHAHRIIDDSPVLPAELLSFLRWCADYYLHPVGEVVCAALPPQLRRGSEADDGRVAQLQLTESGSRQDPDDLKRAPRQRSMLLRLADSPLERRTLLDLENNAQGALRALIERGWVTERRVSRTEVDRPVEAGPSLTDAQREAVDTLRAAGGFQALLIDGVTGSGKTEVYLQMARRQLERGRQVLVLVPEIGLTPQFLRRVRARLPGRVVAYHSAMAAGERAAAWWAASRGEAAVLVGTRSAVFTPMPRLGLIIVDEEHDGSFKQHEGFRYHARDVAVMRAHRENVPLAMGSATPALESLLNVQRERYQRLALPRRPDQPPTPPVRITDLRGDILHEGLGETLLGRIEAHLERDGQVLLFLNRRGFAPVLMCHDCGWHARCHRCEAHTTVHRRPPRLRCHHCGHQGPVPAQCPECGAAELLHIGEGTERLDAFLAGRFDSVPVLRVDRDSTRRRGSLERIMDRARQGEPCILVGTQMLAKGHHLPAITLAGIVSIDQALFGSDFRATERAAQLVVQVAGRAGRTRAGGEVILQTHHPDHPLLDALTRDSYAAFAQAELVERQKAGWPPFAHLALLRAEAHQREQVESFLDAATRLGDGSEVELWGPVAAPLERRAGRFRMQLLARSDGRPDLHRFLRRWLPAVDALPEARRVRWSLDVDPQDML